MQICGADICANARADDTVQRTRRVIVYEKHCHEENVFGFIQMLAHPLSAICASRNFA